MAFGLLAMTISLPSMQEWGQQLQADASWVQLTFSGYVLTYGSLQLLYGPLSDRHGRRRLLLVGIALAALGSAAAALAPDIHALVAARVLQGTGAAGCAVVGRAAIQDLFEGHERTRVMAYVGMAMGLCPPLATVIGGQLHVHFGWRANFVLLTVLALLLWAMAWHALPRTPARAAAHDDHWLRAMASAYAQLAREPEFRANVAVLALTSAAFYTFLGAAPFVLLGYGVGPGTVGLYIMLTPLSYMAGNFAASHLVRRRGEAWMRRAGQAAAVTGIVLVLLLAAVGVRHALAFSLPLMLLGIGHGLLIPPTLVATVGLVPALAGAAAAGAGVAQQLVGAIGGYLGGAVPHGSPVPTASVMLAFTLAASVAPWLLGSGPGAGGGAARQRAASAPPTEGGTSR